MTGVRVALFAATVTLLAIVDTSIAQSTRQSLQCKNIARDVIINSCKGPRMKRSPESPSLARLNQEAPIAVKTEAAEARDDDEPRLTQSKRNFFPPLYGMPPIPMFGGNYASNNYHQTDLSLPGLGFMDTGYANTMEESYLPPNPFGYQPGYMIRSVNPNDLLGFSLSADELEELYHEIGDRMPRNSKNLNKKIFQHVAMKCCPNAQLCYDNPRIIPCMGLPF
ncbi:uncharacterized protein LOC122531894 [Frieseomelitta varia]|uniref:uncharacterized protein LOC122531894 n=1 Tax=Frieseomelitta varia TaxID=561572 RepID=UPI001CB697B8|nr:uncharacterized protein LOC122531894 [Frieseomelitta varia]XP_043516109.1 uncharacterized protein LOC122531894 [Frieseomelitta varia]